MQRQGNPVIWLWVGVIGLIFVVVGGVLIDTGFSTVHGKTVEGGGVGFGGVLFVVGLLSLGCLCERVLGSGGRQSERPDPPRSPTPDQLRLEMLSRALTEQRRAQMVERARIETRPW